MSGILQGLMASYPEPAPSVDIPISIDGLQLWIDGTTDGSSTFYDVSGQGHNLTKAGTINVTSESIGNKVTLATESGKLTGGVGSAVSGDFSVTSLINVNQTVTNSNHALIWGVGSGADANAANIFATVYNGNLYFCIWGWEFLVSYSGYFDTNTLLTCTYTASTHTKEIFLNGVSMGTNTTNTFGGNGTVFKINEFNWTSSATKGFSFYNTVLHNRIITTEEMTDLVTYYGI